MLTVEKFRDLPPGERWVMSAQVTNAFCLENKTGEPRLEKPDYEEMLRLQEQSETLKEADPD